MNRLSFLKKIGLGAVAVAIAPTVIAEIKPDNTLIWDEEAVMSRDFKMGMWYPRCTTSPTPLEILRIRKQTGELIWSTPIEKLDGLEGFKEKYQP